MIMAPDDDDIGPETRQKYYALLGHVHTVLEQQTAELAEHHAEQERWRTERDSLHSQLRELSGAFTALRTAAASTNDVEHAEHQRVLASLASAQQQTEAARSELAMKSASLEAARAEAESSRAETRAAMARAAAAEAQCVRLRAEAEAGGLRIDQQRAEQLQALLEASEAERAEAVRAVERAEKARQESAVREAKRAARLEADLAAAQAEAKAAVAVAAATQPPPPPRHLNKGLPSSEGVLSLIHI